MQWVVLTRSRPMRPVIVILVQSVSPCRSPMLVRLFFLGMWCILVCHPHLTIILCCTVVLGTGMRVGSQNKFFHFRASLVHSASAIVFTSLSLCRWGSIKILLLLVYSQSDLRNCDNSCSGCISEHFTVSRYCRFCARLEDGRSTQLVAERHVGRNHGNTLGNN